MEWLQNLTPGHWLVIGFVLLALEVGAGIAYLLGPGFAALLVALVHWVYPLSSVAQLVVFLLGSIVATFAYARFFRNADDNAAAEGLHNRLHSMVGKETTLESAIDGNARVPFGDTLWRIRSSAPIASGCKIRVVGVDIDILLVEEI